VLFEQEITFRIDYTVPSIAREFGTVFLGDKNVAMLVVSQGWAKVEYCVIYLWICMCKVWMVFHISELHC
jgi:endonuclease YncB( thermonuclease family)